MNFKVKPQLKIVECSKNELRPRMRVGTLFKDDERGVRERWRNLSVCMFVCVIVWLCVFRQIMRHRWPGWWLICCCCCCCFGSSDWWRQGGAGVSLDVVSVCPCFCLFVWVFLLLQLAEPIIVSHQGTKLANRIKGEFWGHRTKLSRIAVLSVCSNLHALFVVLCFCFPCLVCFFLFCWCICRTKVGKGYLDQGHVGTGKRVSLCLFEVVLLLNWICFGGKKT